MFVTVDKPERFKSFVSQTTSIRLELSSSNAEIADYFFKLRVTMFSAV